MTTIKAIETSYAGHRCPDVAAAFTTARTARFEHGRTTP